MRWMRAALAITETPEKPQPAPIRRSQLLPSDAGDAVDSGSPGINIYNAETTNLCCAPAKTMTSTRSRLDADLSVLLLPGLDGTGQLFGPMLQSAPIGFSPRAVEYPTTLSSYEDLAPIVRAQRPQGRWICVAESFSGPLAVQLAAEQPQGLVALVLVATAARWSRRRWMRLLPPAMFWPLPGRTLVARFLLLGGSASEQLVFAWKQAVAAVAPEVLTARLRGFVDADVTAALLAVEVPILYLQASYDRCVGDAEREWILRVRPTSEWCRIKGPHFLLQSQPEAVWREIARFAHARRLRNQS